MKRAALYTRVSTFDQHPETQLLDLRAMAAQLGLELVAEYTDTISGARARRPGLDQLMRDARHGRFDVVLVWAFDRLARSVRHFLETLDELNRLNVEFISFREQIDTGGPLSRAIVVIIGAIAALERVPDRRAGARRHAPRPPRRPAHRTPAARSGSGRDPARSPARAEPRRPLSESPFRSAKDATMRIDRKHLFRFSLTR